MDKQKSKETIKKLHQEYLSLQRPFGYGFATLTEVQDAYALYKEAYEEFQVTATPEKSKEAFSIP